MPITQELYRLGNSTERLNHGSEQLNHMIAGIDGLLERLMIGLDYVYPRPVAEFTTIDANGKRVIEVSYLAYLRVQRGYHLSIKTVKVLESKLSAATESPGVVVPLLQAPRRIRYQAVELLPDLVAGLAEQVDEMVDAMDRRCQIAFGLMQHLQQIAGPADPQRTASAADSATSHRRQTVVPGEGMSIGDSKPPR